jgi:hypothetical protein
VSEYEDDVSCVLIVIMSSGGSGEMVSLRENSSPNCPTGSGGGSGGVSGGKKKKMKTVTVVKEVLVSDDEDEDEDADHSAVENRGIKGSGEGSGSGGSSEENPSLSHSATHSVTESTTHTEPKRTSWAYAIIKFFFLLSLMGTVASGVFVAHTVHTAPNSKLGKLFIKSGNFITDLVVIITDDKAPLLSESDIVKDAVANKVPVELVEPAKKKGKKKVKVPVTTETPTVDTTGLHLNTDGSSSKGFFDSIVSTITAWTEEEAVEEEEEDEIIEEEEEEEVENSLDQSDGELPRVGLTDVVGIVLIIGSVIIRYRPTMRALNEAQTKYFRKEKNVKFARSVAYFAVFLCTVLVGGWFALFRSTENEITKTSGGLSRMISLDSEKGKLSLSDVIAVIIVVLSVALFVTKQLTRVKPINSSKIKRA